MDKTPIIIISAGLLANFILIGIFTPFILNIDQVQILGQSLGGEATIISSPNILIRVDTLNELLQLKQSLNATLYYDSYYFYVIPNSYLGYQWVPTYSFSFYTAGTITNR